MRSAPVRRNGLVMLGLTFGLGACATFSPDAGMAPVTDAARAQLGAEVSKITSETDAAQARARVVALLTEPLSQEAAVRIALANNRDLQAAYNDLGLAEIASVAAGLPPNPRLSFGRLGGGGVVEWEVKLMGDILALATLPSRKEIARQRFAIAQQAAIEATNRLALDVRRAWVNAVAAREAVAQLGQARAAADASSALMRQLGETGAANRLDQARTNAMQAEFTAQHAQAQLRERAARESLIRLLGLWDMAAQVRLPARLPALPRTAKAFETVEADAVSQRADLRMLRRDVALAARTLDLTAATRMVSLLELAGLGSFERDAEGRLDRGGFEVELEIPIFDGGEVKLRRETETYMRAVNRLMAKAIAARSEARAARDAYLTSHAIARRYQGQVLPLRRVVARETLLRYNGMLVDTFDLLTEARDRAAAHLAAIAAHQAFLLAEINLRGAIIGGGGAPMAETVEAAPAAKAESGGH